MLFVLSMDNFKASPGWMITRREHDKERRKVLLPHACIFSVLKRGPGLSELIHLFMVSIAQMAIASK